MLWKDIDDRYIKQKGESQLEPSKLETPEIAELLIHCSKELSETILFLDAPNESKQASIILQSLFHTVQSSTSLKIMMSSTEDLGAIFNSPLVITVTMGQQMIASDMKDYIEAWLQNNENLRDLQSALKEDIKLTLQKGADGMYHPLFLIFLTAMSDKHARFRWVQCQLENLVDQNTADDMRVALRNVPNTLERTYRNILAMIPKGDIQITKRALFWLSFSLKPMTFAELCEAVIIGHNNAVINDGMRLLRPKTKALLKNCSSLISYDSATTQVTLAHSSVLGYLTSKEIQDSDAREFYLDEANADASICIRCINYLCLPAFRSGYCLTDDALAQRFNDWPLLPYIAETLFEHLSYITICEPVATILQRFFSTYTDPRSGSFGAWVQAFYPAGHSNIESSTPLYYAARFGLLAVVRMILAIEGTKNLEVPGGVFGSTPLHVAAWQGRTEVVKDLLAAGAEAREVNAEGVPGLFWAVKSGHTAIERMLRDAGATLEIQSLVDRFPYSP